MKLFVLLMAFVGTLCSARAETLWVAEARVIAVTAACADTTKVGDFYRAIYRPMGTSIGNGANSYLALFSQRSAFWMGVPNNTFQFGVNYVGQVISSTITMTSNSGGVLDWQESVAFGAPSSSNVTASLANFYADKGCTATLRMPFIKLP